MHVEVYDDHEEMGQAAADAIARCLSARPDSLLCAATGSTPTRAYSRFASRPDARRLAADSRVIKLDEWGGLAMDDPGSFETYLHRHLLSPLAVPPERYITWRSDASDAPAEAARIRAAQGRAGTIDLCVLGLGLNGHLGFNEPSPELQAGPHVAVLTPSSLRHAMLQAAGRQPTHGLTLGMGDIGQARRVLLLVSGPAKRAQLRCLRSGNITTQFPASLLWLHPAVRVLCDRAAAGD